MGQKADENRIHLLFRVGLIIKSIGAAAEMIAGVLALFITPTFVLSVATWLTQDELIEDPTDPVSNYILNSAHHFSIGYRTFIVLYLLSHGLVKMLTLSGLFKKKLWAYPLSIAVFFLFIFYQIYRYVYTQSLWLMVLTVFDLAVVWLIWKEYSFVKKDLQAKA